MSFRELLREARDAVQAARPAADQDPWERLLRRLKGRVGHDGNRARPDQRRVRRPEVPMPATQHVTPCASRPSCGGSGGPTSGRAV